MRLFLLTLCVISNFASASYRVYRLKVEHYDHKNKVRSVEQVLSNLDPLQYEHYHTGYRVDRVTLLDTWYCPGDTKRREYCKKPKWKEPFVKDPREKRIPYNYQPVIP